VSWGFNPSAWTTGTIPTAANFQQIAADLHTLGGNRDGSGYGLPNTSFITLLPGDLPGTTYTVSGTSWASSVALLGIGANNIQVGQHVSISGITPAGYNTLDAVVTAITGTGIKYALAVNPGSWVSGGVVIVGGVSPAAGMLAVSPSKAPVFHNGGAFISPASLFFSSITTSAAIANTTAVTPFSINATLPANVLSQPGMVVRIRAAGTFSTTGTPTLALYIVLGPALLVAQGFTCPSGAVNYGWSLTADIVIRATGSSGVAVVGCNMFVLETQISAVGPPNPTTVDTTVSQVVNVGVVWGTASPSNTVTMGSFEVEVLGAQLVA
jgi:hypothetical protein